jgi:hypothetical protein
MLCDDQNACTSDSCDPDSGCLFTAVGGVCSDQDDCTAGDTCSGGACQPGSAKVCEDGNPCTTDHCSGGACGTSPKTGGSCDDGNLCTTGDQCVAGVCQGSGGEGCCETDIQCDDGNPCTKDVCSAGGQCSSTPGAMNGVGCNADSDGCTLNDVCQNGQCQAGAAVDCSGSATACTDAVCQSTGIQSSKCGLTSKSSTTACEDGLYCTVNDLCDGNGACKAGPARDCSAEGGGCTAGTCDENANACGGNPKTDGTPCNADDNGCTVSDACLAGSCVAGEPADCSWLGSGCTNGLCVPDGPTNPHGYACEADYKAPGTACEDGQFCTVNDTCDGAGWCASGLANPCADGVDACNSATCDENTNTCTPQPVTNGTTCNDGDACTLGETCQAGKCAPSENLCGDFKVSTFKTAYFQAPTVADLGAGRYSVLWQDSSQDFVNGRSYTDSWSKEGQEFSVTGLADDLAIDAAGLAGGGAVVARTSRTKSLSVTGSSCHSSFGGGCTDGTCGGFGSYYYAKYSGSASLDERVELTWLDASSKATQTVLVLKNTASTAWSYVCDYPAAFTYTTNFGNLKVAAAPNGRVMVLWSQDTATKAKLYKADGTLQVDLGTLGTYWHSFDVASHADDSFVVVWSNGSDLFGQNYAPTGEPDGSQVTISNATGTQADPALATYSNGRLVVAWRSDTNLLMTRVFKKDGSPVGPIEVQVTTAPALPPAYLPDAPAVGAYNLDGSFVVAWTDTTASDDMVRARFFNKNAQALADPVQVNVTSGGRYPTVTSLSSQEAIIAWRGANGMIRARKYSPAGVALTHSAELVHNATTAHDQAAPAVAGQGAQGYIAVWERGTAANDIEITGRRFDALGAPLGAEIAINGTQPGWQTAPSVATAPSGGFVAAWESYGQDGDVEGVYARGFEADGIPHTTEVAVNQTTDYEQIEPQVAVDRSLGSTGAFAVTWASFGQPAGATYDVMARCFDAGGKPLSNELMVNGTTADDQRMAAIVALPAGPSRYLVAWASKNEDGDNWGIYARRLAGTCGLQGEPLKVNTTTANVQSHPALAAASDGSFVVAWRSLNQDGSNYGIYAQRYTNGGTATGTEFLVNPVTAGEQSYPTLSLLSDDSLVAAWVTVGEDENGAAVKARRYKPDLSADGLDFLVNIYHDKHQDSPVVAPVGTGGYVILWRSEGQDGSGSAVIGRVLP